MTTTELAKKTDMYVLYITDITGREIVEIDYIHPSEAQNMKNQLIKNTFIDLGDRMLPRKRIADFRLEKRDDSIMSFLMGLDEITKAEAKNIIAERQNKKLKLNGVEHLKQILTDRGFKY